MVSAGIEWVQLGIPGRIFGWSDLFRDFYGIMVAFLWLVGIASHKGYYRVGSIAAIVVLLSVSTYPLAVVLIDENQARWDFPLLAGFESKFELSRWADKAAMRLVKKPVGEGEQAAAVELTTDKYSGVALLYFPGDWRNLDHLNFSVYNPGEPVILHCRIHDKSHLSDQSYKDRHNGQFFLSKGWNDIAVSVESIRNGPEKRKLDLGNIRGFGLFLMDQNTERVLYLDDIRLE